VLLLSEVELAGKRVLIREDLNVPIAGGAVSDDTRIRAALPTIRQTLAAGARVMLVSHLGRPEEGVYDASLTLAPVAAALTQLLGQDVSLARDWIDGVELAEGACILCENVRFLPGEKANDDGLARRMAALCDVFVNDAFATAHRAQASTHGIAKYAPVACAGPLLQAELDALSAALEAPQRPLSAIVGGAKVSSKLTLLKTLSEKVDHLIVGGGIANTFLKAAGNEIGNSLCEDSLLDEARRILDTPELELPLPSDVVCAKEISKDAAATVKAIADVAANDFILDVGPKSAAAIADRLAGAGTIVWNGPLGMFEIDQFGEGTRRLATAIAASDAFSIAGGGDTLAAISKYGVADRISYISTGGGAFLEYLEGATLPAVAILEQRARSKPL